ncbi:MAG: hypothetical protein AAFR23_05510 [Pseudomonadota bacterium]
MRYVRTGAGLLAAALAFGASAGTVDARSGDNERLGVRQLDRTLDRERFNVGVFGPMRSIRIAAPRGALILRDVTVTFANGRTVDLLEQRRQRINNGSGAVFDFRRARRIARIEIDARATRGGRRTARMVVSGRTAAVDQNPRQFEALELSEFQPDDRRVAFAVGNSEGRFSELKIASPDTRVRVRTVTVQYANNTRERFDVNARVGAGQETAVLRLSGNRPRIVTRVTADIRTRGNTRNARLVLLGRERGRRAAPTPTPPRGNFVVIGDRLSDTRDERIAIPVNPRQDINRIRIRAQENDLVLRRVTFERRRGGSETVRLRERVRAGDVSSAIRVPEGRGRLDLITLRVEASRRRGSVRAVVLADLGRDNGNDGGGAASERIPRNRLRAAPRLARLQAENGRFVRVARQRLSDRRRQYVIDIPRDRRAYDAIVMRSVRAPSRVRVVEITYGNGKTERLPLRTRYDRGEVSQLILLEGDRRRVRRIEIEARTVGNGERDARLAVFLREAPRREDPPARSIVRDGDWVRLGRQKAQMFSKDDDVFKVGREYGRFDAIRVRAIRTDVRLYGMKVTFGNGRTEDVEVFGKLKRGRTTDAVSFRERGRFIDQVALRYRSQFSLRGEGSVEVWGRVAGAPRRAVQREEERPRDTGRRLLRDILRDFEQKFRN